MPSHTIKVTGVSEELLSLIDQRVRHRQSLGRSEYIRELIRNDVMTNITSRSVPSFRELLAPIHAETKRLGVTEEQVDRLAEAERSQRVTETAIPSDHEQRG